MCVCVYINIYYTVIDTYRHSLSLSLALSLHAHRERETLTQLYSSDTFPISQRRWWRPFYPRQKSRAARLEEMGTAIRIHDVARSRHAALSSAPHHIPYSLCLQTTVCCVTWLIHVCSKTHSDSSKRTLTFALNLQAPVCVCDFMRPLPAQDWQKSLKVSSNLILHTQSPHQIDSTFVETPRTGPIPCLVLLIGGE